MKGRGCDGVDVEMGGVFIGGLSGGERKRAGIACEMLCSPPLLFLDVSPAASARLNAQLNVAFVLKLNR